MSKEIALHFRKQRLIINSDGYREWQSEIYQKVLPASRVAMVLCDVWDKHWCRGAAERLEKMLPRMNAVVKAARDLGVLIVHAPSDTMEYYRNTPARKRILALPLLETPVNIDIDEPLLPVDAADGGCDTKNNLAGVDQQVWTCQHPGIDIDQELDVITDNGRALYSFVKHQGIHQLILLGVHTNMCILNRSFAIKQMVKWEQNIALVRDLTDTMYNPASSPYVSHNEGTQLVIQFIEKYWCPTLSSTDFLPLNLEATN